DGVQHGVADLVGHLVGVTFGHALGAERPASHGLLLGVGGVGIGVDGDRRRRLCQVRPAVPRIWTIRSTTAAAIVRLSASGTPTGGSPGANRVTALVSCRNPVAGAPTSLATTRSRR